MTGRELYDRLCDNRQPVRQWDPNRDYRFTQPINEERGAWSAYSFLPEAEKRMLNRVAAALVTRRGASRVK